MADNREAIERLKEEISVREARKSKSSDPRVHASLDGEMAPRKRVLELFEKNRKSKIGMRSEVYKGRIKGLSGQVAYRFPAQ